MARVNERSVDSSGAREAQAWERLRPEKEVLRLTVAQFKEAAQASRQGAAGHHRSWTQACREPKSA